jgi:regulator of Ty1 transposition protein 103
MISDFLAAQQDLETQAEERLEQHRDKLEKVNAVRDDLKSHIQSLPDLTKLPDVTGGLAPLPSAGDLFTK